MSKRSQPNQRYTNADLVLGVVGGFVLSLVLMAVVVIPVMGLLPNSKQFPDWLSATLGAVCVLAGLIVAERIMSGLANARRQQYEWHRAEALRQKQCPTCDYDLRGTIEPRCPECGEKFQPEEWRRGVGG